MGWDRASHSPSIVSALVLRARVIRSVGLRETLRQWHVTSAMFLPHSVGTACKVNGDGYVSSRSIPRRPSVAARSRQREEAMMWSVTEIATLRLTAFLY